MAGLIICVKWSDACLYRTPSSGLARIVLQFLTPRGSVLHLSEQFYFILPPPPSTSFSPLNYVVLISIGTVPGLPPHFTLEYAAFNE